MASELRVTTIANNAGSESVDTTYVVNGSAKAWSSHELSGTASTYDSFNMSSLTDDGQGKSDLAFTNSFSNGTDYSATGMGYQASGATAYSSSMFYGANRNAGSCEFWSVYANAGFADWHDFVRGSVTIHGDLA